MKKNERTFAQVAREIKKAWKKVNYAAEPYLDAMSEIDSNDKNAPYLFDTAASIATRFLANAGTFRGDDAKRLKAELRSMIK